MLYNLGSASSPAGRPATEPFFVRCFLLSVLDIVDDWQLNAILYQDDLRLILAEMILGQPSHHTDDLDLSIRQMTAGRQTLEVREESRLMMVTFVRPVAWQRVEDA